MTSSAFHRRIAVLLLAAMLAMPLASLAAPRTSPQPRDTSSFGAVLSHLWDTLTALWSEDGCSADPYGRCAGAGAGTASPTDSLDEGCSMDPYGRCSAGR
jgi:hypothetical protein